jgi:hypothetical protein
VELSSIRVGKKVFAMLKIPFRTMAVLFLGAALVWLWELALAAFGDHGIVSWTPLVLGIVLFSIAYFDLGIRHHK